MTVLEKKEFEEFFETLIASYPKPTATVIAEPSTLGQVGAKSRDFYQRTDAKIAEFVSRNPSIPLIQIKAEIALLRVYYHGKLMHGHLLLTILKYPLHLGLNVNGWPTIEVKLPVLLKQCLNNTRFDMRINGMI